MPHRQRHSPHWYISYTDATGRRVRQTAGTADYAEAKALEESRRAEAHQQRQWGVEPERDLDHLLLHYLEHKQRTDDPRTLSAARQIYRHLGGRSASRLTGSDITEYIRARRTEKNRHGKHASDATIARELRLLSAAFNHGRKQLGWRIENPVAGRIPRARATRLRWLTRGEYARLLAKARHSRADYLRPLIQLAANTGMRRGELLGLEWSRVDLAHRLIYLQPENNKSGNFQTVPLNDAAVEALRMQQGKHRQWVFAWRGDRVHQLRRSFQSAVQAARIRPCVFHDLRHTCAAWLVQAGVDVRVVRDILRHSSIETTMIYAHLAPKNVHQAVDAINTKTRFGPRPAKNGQNLPIPANMVRLKRT